MADDVTHCSVCQLPEDERKTDPPKDERDAEGMPLSAPCAGTCGRTMEKTMMHLGKDNGWYCSDCRQEIINAKAEKANEGRPTLEELREQEREIRNRKAAKG